MSNTEGTFAAKPYRDERTLEMALMQPWCPMDVLVSGLTGDSGKNCILSLEHPSWDVAHGGKQSPQLKYILPMPAYRQVMIVGSKKVPVGTLRGMVKESPHEEVRKMAKKRLAEMGW